MPVEFDAEIAINEVTLQADSDISTPGVGDTSYLSLTEKPQINGVTLVGNKSTEELNIDHVLVADNLSAHSGTTDTTPYTLRSAPSYAGSVAELRKIVGGTLGWNQLADHPLDTSTTSGITFTKNSDDSYTVSGTATGGVNKRMNTIFPANGHVYLCLITQSQYVTMRISTDNAGTTKIDSSTGYAVVKTDSTWTDVALFLRVASGTAIGTTGVKIYSMIFDLTQMFGSTVADAIYTMETATAGSGVAWFRQYFPSDYYPYSASTLQSVQTSARQALDGNGNVIRSYPLDDSLTLRGIPKLTNGVLSYDGDIYLPTGEVTRKYGIVELGSLEWSKNSTYGFMQASVADSAVGVSGTIPNIISDGYITAESGANATIDSNNADKTITIRATARVVIVKDSAYTDAATFKTAMNGKYLVYLLQTPTTEEADPYAEIQTAGETEQFVSDNYIPVGNESFYPTDLTGVVQNLAPLPTAAGTYKLQVTVSGGVPSYSWVAG